MCIRDRPSGETLEAAYVSATATIGEKISFRRFEMCIRDRDQTAFSPRVTNGQRDRVLRAAASLVGVRGGTAAHHQLVNRCV